MPRVTNRPDVLLTITDEQHKLLCAILEDAIDIAARTDTAASRRHIIELLLTVVDQYAKQARK